MKLQTWQHRDKKDPFLVVANSEELNINFISFLIVLVLEGMVIL